MGYMPQIGALDSATSSDTRDGNSNKIDLGTNKFIDLLMGIEGNPYLIISILQ